MTLWDRTEFLAAEMEVDPMNPNKAILQPRHPGENIKVAQTVLKRRDRNLKAAAERAAQVVRARKQQAQQKKGKLNIIRAEQLVKDCRTRIVDRHRIKSQQKKKKPRLQTGSTLAVGRNGRQGGSKEAKIALSELGLTRKHSLVFLRNDAATVAKLQVCKPFAFWGSPSFKVIFNIVHKKAVFRDPNGEHGKTVLSDNTLIETHLGDLGILCTEDLAHVVGTGGKHFEEVVRRLWPVVLGNVKKAAGMVHDKKFTFGDLKEEIDATLGKLIGN